MFKIIPLISRDMGAALMVGLITGIGIMIYNYFNTAKEREIEKRKREINREEIEKEKEQEAKEKSLEELKNKGIITDEEYFDKSELIKKKKINDEIINSYEYNQLQELYENDIFSKEEFERKVELLKIKLTEKYNSSRTEEFSILGEFHEGLAKVWDKNQNYGFIDENHKLVIPTEYEFADDFSEGLAVVRLNEKFGFIDKYGETAISFIFNDANSFINGKAKVKNEQEFYIDKKGNRIG